MAPTTVAAEHEFETRILTPPYHQFEARIHTKPQHQFQPTSKNNGLIDKYCLGESGEFCSHNMMDSEEAEPDTNAQFLPICDLMFNMISMIAYFCDSTFNIIAFVALYNNPLTRIWANLGFTFICFSSLVCQSLSLKWSLKAQFEQYKRKIEEAQTDIEEEKSYQPHLYQIHHITHSHLYNSRECECIPENNLNNLKIRSSYYMAILIESIIHCLQGGILLRYIRLVIPVADRSGVRKDVRDLCILKICHAFCQSAPLLLFQTYIIWTRASPAFISNLSITSALLSLFSVCWALASFTKYVREKFLHRFVLTWLGVITQLLWRTGTVSSRVVALTIYAAHYGYWVVVVLILHWSSMFLWLLLPNNLLRDEEDQKSKKLVYAGMTAWVYCFCYINFEERNSKQKMFIYYSLMFLENNLLLSVCLGFSSHITWYRNLSILTIYLGFISGIVFMFIYYRHFHVNVLNLGFSSSDDSIDSIAEHLPAVGLPCNAPLAGVFSCKFNPAFTKQFKGNQVRHC